ncbi:hypothetical protein MHYP_G00144320 [Metynnis hypsauchen]
MSTPGYTNNLSSSVHNYGRNPTQNGAAALHQHHHHPPHRNGPDQSHPAMYPTSNYYAGPPSAGLPLCADPSCPSARQGPPDEH